MYNTLNDIQKSLSESDLKKYADKITGKTPEEIVEILKLDNVEISIEAAKECINFLGKTGSISDEELENVAGGGCGSDPEPKYKKGQRIYRDFSTTINRRYYTIIEVCEYNSNNNSYRYVIKPDDSNSTQERYLDSDSSYKLA